VVDNGRQGRGRRLRRVVGLGMAVGLLLALTGCRYHVDFTVREGPNGAVTFRLLSGSGRHVVVEASGAGATVPSAGWWRVDREDGSADPLPSAATHISADGARVLLATGALWDEGTVVAAPAIYSDDLTHRVFPSGGVVTSQAVATGTTVAVEAAYPRPSGTTAATPISISDDGQTVRYRLARPAGAIDRIVRLGQPTPLDLPAPTSGGATRVAYQVAAGGTALARTTEEWTTIDHPDWGPLDVMVGATVELVAVPSGAVTATMTSTYEPTTTRWPSLDRVAISEDGSRVWTNETTSIQDGNTCGWGSPTFPLSCTVENRLTAIAAGHTRTHPLGGGALVGWDLTPDGSLLVTDRRVEVPAVIAGTAPQITHAVHGDWETLAQGPTTTSDSYLVCVGMTGRPPPCTIKVVGAATQISDDGKVLSARSMTGAGWYDYVDPPDPPT
jgi:hypothetical protein